MVVKAQEGHQVLLSLGPQRDHGVEGIRDDNEGEGRYDLSVGNSSTLKLMLLTVMVMTTDDDFAK